MANPTLVIAPESVCSIIAKAREIDTEDVLADPDSMTGAAEERATAADMDADDPTRLELATIIDELSDEDQIDLVALMWLGRGDGTLEDWDDLRDEAEQQHNERTTAYLLSEPLLADHLDEGLSQFGLSCAEFEGDRP